MGTPGFCWMVSTQMSAHSLQVAADDYSTQCTKKGGVSSTRTNIVATGREWDTTGNICRECPFSLEPCEVFVPSLGGKTIKSGIKSHCDSRLVERVEELR
jgi:hypothetical protein